MATRTTYYELIKPSQTDPVDVRDLNTNFDNIDAIMHTNETNIDALDNRMTIAESDIDDLQEATEHLSDGDTVYPYASEIEIEDALGVNAKDVKVKIDPVQDLHGYDKPWAGGSGKNILPITLANLVTSNTTGTWNGKVYTKASGTVFTVRTDDDNNVTSIDCTTVGNGGDITLNFTLDAGTYILSSGFTEYYGMNDTLLFDSSNNVIARGNAQSPGQTFTLSAQDNLKWVFRITNSTKICTPMIRLSTVSDATFEPYSNICPISGWNECEIEVTDGEETTKIYTIQLGDTIYGGTIDATTGAMTVTHGIREFDGSEVWIKSSTTDYDVYMQTIGSSDLSKPFLTNEFYYANSNYGLGCARRGSSNEQIRVYFANYNTTTVEDFKTYLASNNLQVVYELATPFTIDLTPQQIQLLEGYNLISANTGDISITTTDIKGAIGQADELIEANTKAIEDLTDFDLSIFGTVEKGTTASQAYAQGDYFVKDKKMCKALTSIAQGATFTLGTNYAQYTLAEILKAIEQS